MKEKYRGEKQFSSTTVRRGFYIPQRGGKHHPEMCLWTFLSCCCFPVYIGNWCQSRKHEVLSDSFGIIIQGSKSFLKWRAESGTLRWHAGHGMSLFIYYLGTFEVQLSLCTSEGLWAWAKALKGADRWNFLWAGNDQDFHRVKGGRASTKQPLPRPHDRSVIVTFLLIQKSKMQVWDGSRKGGALPNCCPATSKQDTTALRSTPVLHKSPY